MTRLHGLAVVEEGPADAPVVVLVHGSMDRMAGFARVASRLARDYRVVRYDRRGYGRSVHHPGPFGIADHIDDLVDIVGGRAAVLVGHSMGGNVALGAAARLPDLVRGVAVYEIPLSWLPNWPSNSATARVAADPHDPADVAESFMRRMVGSQRWERLPMSTREARRAEGRALVEEIRTLRARAPWDPAAISVPVVVGRGSEGQAHHRAGMEELVGWFAHARLVELAGAGHLAHVSAAEAFTEQIVRPLLHRLGW
jgi:pimeloyl-ACP methyl ester carboxylesterase